MTNTEYTLPKDIERRSFEIISEELGKMGISLPRCEADIIKRVIHTTADFGYTDTMRFSNGAVSIARELIVSGADIVTDTNMALAGINRKKLADFGGKAHCFMAEEETARLAEKENVTRAAASVDIASRIKKPLIYVVGNAPTALMRLYELSKEKIWSPAFIIGVPVGFVNVEASKELIMETDIPFIVNRGRKGGSNVAAAIVNALIYGAERMTGR